MSEKVVETKICKHCNSSFEITDKDLEFYDKISPVFTNPGVKKETPGLKLSENGKIKYQIPSPTLCSDCRQQRRLSFRNERKLYRRICDATGKPIISIYSPDKPYKIYNQDFWWSDKWNSMDYGINFDFNKSFFTQFGEFSLDIPKIQNLVTLNENSDYTNGSAYNKNCYLIFASDHNEDCYYSDNIYRTKDTFDSSDLNDCTLCYECIGSTKCNNCSYIFDCHDNNNLRFCFDLINCNECFLSTNLRNKKYFFKNIEYSKDEYSKKIDEYKNKSNNEILQELLKVKNNSIHLYFHGDNNENCLGDYISHCKDSLNVFSANNMENCKNIINGNWAKDCQDSYVVVDNSTLVYESVSIISLNKGAFNFGCWNSSFNIYYCDHCQNCSNLFGCIGIRNKQYCILNKQYTKQEYNKLVPKIIEHMKKTGEWGEFFPSSISPFGYNETVAQEYFPLPHPNPLLGEEREQDQKGLFQFTPFTFKGENIEVKFNRSDYEQEFPKVEKIISANKLPENIKDIPDDILNRAIECEVTKKPFRIIKQELEFYRKHNLPIPKRHPDQRHLDRMALRNSRKLFDRKCDKCHIDMKTTYSPEREEIVYCESCYNKEVY